MFTKSIIAGDRHWLYPINNIVNIIKTIHPSKYVDTSMTLEMSPTSNAVDDFFNQLHKKEQVSVYMQQGDNP